MIAIAVIAFTIFHPGYCFRKSGAESAEELGVTSSSASGDESALKNHSQVREGSFAV